MVPRDPVARAAYRRSKRSSLKRRYDLGRGRFVDLWIGRPVQMPTGEWGAACSITGVPNGLEVLIFQIDPILAVLQAIRFAEQVLPGIVGSPLRRVRREWGDDLGLAIPKTPKRRKSARRPKSRTAR